MVRVRCQKVNGSGVHELFTSFKTYGSGEIIN